MAEDIKSEVPNDLVDSGAVYLHNQGGADVPTDLNIADEAYVEKQVAPITGVLSGAGVKVLGQPIINAIAKERLGTGPSIVSKDGLASYAKGVFGQDALGGSTQSRIQHANKVALGEKIKSAGQVRGAGIRMGGSQLAPEKTIAEKILTHVPESSKGLVKSTGTVLGRGLSGAVSGFDVADAWNRAQAGDYLGATVSGIGALGGLASLVPHPIVKGAGTALSIGAPMLNTYLDKSREEKQRGFAEGGEVQHFDEGGGAYVGYPQIHNRPRKQGYASGVLAGLTGLENEDDISVLDPNGQAYLRGKEAGEPLGIASMIPVNPASALRGTAKFLAPKAGQMAEKYMISQGLIKPIVGDAAKPSVDRINMHFKDVTKRIPELQNSAQQLVGGQGSRELHEALVNKYKPVKPFEFVPQPATREEAMNALAADKKDLYGVPSQTLQPGHPVGLRLDIPAYSNHGVWVPTIHEQASGFGAGKSIGHESVASVLNPAFGMSDKAALSIAAGKPKGTIATIKGEWNPVNQEQAVANAQDYLNHPDWRQVGMDPERHGYFYDRATMEPITHAEEALQIGPLVLAKKPVYGKKEDFKFSEGGEVQHFQVGRIVKKVVGEAFDPRFDKRVIEQNKLKNLTTHTEQTGVVDVPSINLGNYVDYPVITSMSDRSLGGNRLLGVNDVMFNNPVDLTGGKLYMYNNPGQGWASGKQPVNQIMKLADELKRQTGKDPLYIPWRMAPSASDYAHMTGETMLAHAQAGLGRSDKKTFDNTIKKFIPDWAGVDNPASLEQFRQAPAVVRKSVQNAIDRDMRNSGALGLGETRLAIADPAQLNAPEGGLSHVAQIFASKPIIENSGNITYPKGVPGQGLGKLDQDLIVTQLLPNMVKERGIIDPRNPSAQDLRALQMKPYATTLSPEILKSIGLKKGGSV